ncbi:MAG: hypothetical protein R2748_33125 [Bryobacterales bacterium]
MRACTGGFGAETGGVGGALVVGATGGRTGRPPCNGGRKTEDPPPVGMRGTEALEGVVFTTGGGAGVGR